MTENNEHLDEEIISISVREFEFPARRRNADRIGHFLFLACRLYLQKTKTQNENNSVYGL